jgi:hypothetical protein
LVTVVSTLVNHRQNLDLGAEVNLDAQAGSGVSNFVSISAIRKERPSDNAEYFVSPIAPTRATPGLPQSAERRNRCVEIFAQVPVGARFEIWMLWGRGYLVGRRTAFGCVFVFPGCRFPRSASQTFWNCKEAATARTFPPFLVAEEMHHAVMISPTHQ